MSLRKKQTLAESRRDAGGSNPPLSYCLLRRWAPHNQGIIMANVKTKSVFTLDINQEETIALYQFLKVCTHDKELDDLEEELRLALSCSNLI